MELAPVDADAFTRIVILLQQPHLRATELVEVVRREDARNLASVAAGTQLPSICCILLFPPVADLSWCWHHVQMSGGQAPMAHANIQSHSFDKIGLPGAVNSFSVLAFCSRVPPLLPATVNQYLISLYR